MNVKVSLDLRSMEIKIANRQDGNPLIDGFVSVMLVCDVSRCICM